MIDTFTYTVVSYGMDQSRPAGNARSISAMRARTAVPTSSAFAPGFRKMPIGTVGLPLRAAEKLYSREPSSIRATSLSRTIPPVSVVRSTICPNCSGSASRPRVVTEKVKPTSPDIGSSPTRPAANWAFCSRTAAATSEGVSPSWARRSGRSQTRIE